MLKRYLKDIQGNTKESLLTRIREKPFQSLVIFLCLVNLILAVVNAGLWLIAVFHQYFYAADFTIYYTAFTMVKEKAISGIYNQEVVYQYLHHILGNGFAINGEWLTFLYPPFFALIFVPLSYVPLNAAYYLWSIGEVGLLILVIHSLLHIFADWNRGEKIGLFLTLMAFWPLAHTFLLGQISLIFVLGLLQIHSHMRKKNDVSAGIWLSIFILKPQILIMPALMTLNKRFWRIAAIAIVSFLIIVIVSSVWMGFGAWVQYSQFLRTVSASFGRLGVFPEQEFTLRGMLYNMLGQSQGSLINRISIIAFILGMVLVLILWLKKNSPEKPIFNLNFALMITLSVILSLHLFDHDSLILVPAAAMTYDYLRKKNYSRKLFTIVILASPMVFLAAAFTQINILGFIRPPIILILILFLWISRYIFKELREKPGGDIPNAAPVNTALM